MLINYFSERMVVYMKHKIVDFEEFKRNHRIPGRRVATQKKDLLAGRGYIDQADAEEWRKYMNEHLNQYCIKGGPLDQAI